MHHHLEIIMPPAQDVEAAIEQVMHRYDENGDRNLHAVWDWYVIGGSYAGSKLKARYGEGRIQAFREKLHEMGVTASSVQFGKPALNHANQIPVVDELWREWFPNAGEVCPLFQHFDGKYGEDTAMAGDLCTLAELPDALKAYRVIVAGPGWQSADKLIPQFMAEQEIWNGVNWQKTRWDGSVRSALELASDTLKYLIDEYREKRMPLDDWVAVTVDYYS